MLRLERAPLERCAIHQVFLATNRLYRQLSLSETQSG
jgi:hypothetical protein